MQFEIPGKHRVFYKATNFQEGIIVTTYLILPNLSKTDDITLTEVGDGLYCFDYDFVTYGKYGCLIKEDGIKKIFFAIQVGD